MSDWQSIGPHRYRFQGEVLYFEPHGEVTPSQAAAWLDVLVSHFERQGRGFLMVNARAIKPPSRYVRRMFLSRVRERGLRPRIVGFGVNRIVRAVARTILALARRLLGLQLDVSLYATEAEAWAHVDRAGGPGQSATAVT
jgi:hypothetical protein